ncbi:MAG: cation:proton antiporter [Anaerolineae bacterium]|jgi:Kef-type K+ transport system membrane component KefB|nr:cation:proton antiporter [Anaerolineae bacterium]MBT4310744.1 cation:proton antiporter [Anaerolineae bacterium]MBT4456832.1 cation:proton antiporter [Anaerolineae bacterium]MBT4841708.1 cation:proton antiporter [Anaerolineae bacterium]MBT6062932.1 cation:proton antiporter [Anaerolineae bacterium]
MTPFLQFLIAIVVIIAAAKIGGYLSLKLGQPSVLGELAVGIILGPSVLDMLHWAPFTDKHLADAIAHIAELGVLLLMFIAGLELHLSDLAKSGKVSALAGTLGVFLPLGMGYGLARAFSFDDQSALFIGLVLAATSVSISAQTLMEMKVLRTRVGIGLLGAAVFDDILVVLGLSIFVALAVGSGGFWGIVWIALRMFLYMGIAAAVGMALFPKLSRKIDSLPISQGLMAFVLIVAFFYAWSAEVLGGMAAITGAFLAGLVFARSPLKDRIETGVSTLAYSFFVPVFFVNVGLAANAKLLTGESLWLLLTMIVVAVISKVLGSGLGARIAGFTNLEALQMGAGMTSRGEVGLIVASVGVAEGMISTDIFAVIVGVVIVTTLLTPAMLRVLFAKNKAIA